MEVKSQNILFLVKAVQNGNKAGQRKLYELYYSYGMSICLRYAANKEEAQEILNDSFYKVFTKIDQYNQARPFKQWFRAILIHSAIDYHRKYHKLEPFSELDDTDAQEPVGNDGWDNLLYDDVMECVQQLPPQYRLVFNLFAVDELNHREISQRLDISIGTSKSNYSKARRKLQEILKKNGHLKFYNHA
ncbi:MAG TPA: RNA polymerase sigma factor [Bacteroidetes bacterium]|nr:RNA polymerase sigma factor [Bacteroidota bacterium]